LYPNPAVGTAYLSLPSNAQGTYVLNINDATGRLVRTQTIDQVSGALTTPVDLGEIPAGVYTVEVLGAELPWKQKLTIQ
jgi:hypothetical protein